MVSFSSQTDLPSVTHMDKMIGMPLKRKEKKKHCSQKYCETEKSNNKSKINNEWQSGNVLSEFKRIQ